MNDTKLYVKYDYSYLKVCGCHDFSRVGCLRIIAFLSLVAWSQLVGVCDPKTETSFVLCQLHLVAYSHHHKKNKIKV